MSLVQQLQASKEFFDRSTRCLTEDDSGFAPAEGLWTVAQQVAHIAQTVDWLIDGGFGSGFDMNFEKHARETAQVTSLADARARLERAYQRAIDTVTTKSEAELAEALPENPFMKGPRCSVIEGVIDHTAHHRGALTVYSRLRGHTPAMPYGEGF